VLVTTTGSAMAEVVDDHAILVRPRDPAGLAGALTRAISDTELRTRLRSEGPRRAQDFTWAASVDQHLAAYATATGDRA
jgi:glycosyltransferase involved in cell wall biosynthesis